MKLILAFIASLLASPALAQSGSSVKQSGYVTPGHAVYWVTNGVVADGGTAANGNLTSLGVTASGPGICQNSAKPSTGPYNELCFAPTNTGGGFTWYNYNGATGVPSMTINGTVYPFPFSTSGAVGPSSTTVGDQVYWANTSGTLLGDSGTSTCALASNIGFVGDGSTANDTAFSSWFSSLPNGGGCLQFGAGTYIFNSLISKTLYAGKSGITIKGLGGHVTFLKWPNAAGGIKFTAGSALNSVHIRDLSLLTSQAAGGTGIFLSGLGCTSESVPEPSDIQNVEIHGTDFTPSGSSSDYWTIGVNILSWCSVNTLNLAVLGPNESPGSGGGGIGLQYGGTSGSAYATILNVNSSFFNFLQYGIVLNSYWQGVTISQSNFGGEIGSDAILGSGGQSGVLSLLNISNSQFNYGNGTEIALLTDVDNVTLLGNTITIYGNNNVAVSVPGGLYFTAIGNFFNVSGSPTGTYAIEIGSVTDGIVAGNTFDSTANGIDLQSGSSNIVVSQNAYDTVTTAIINSGSGNTILDHYTPGTNGQIFTGQTGASPAFETMSGDCTFSDAGAIACTKINGVSLTLGAALTTTGTSATTLAFPSSGTPTYTFPSVTASIAPLASPTFSGTVTMPDSGTWTSSGIGATTINATSGFKANGTAGVSTTCTVTASDTLVFTEGLLTTKGSHCT